MNKTKFRSMTITALALALAFVLSMAIGSLALFRRASAAEYRPTELFSYDNSAEIGATETQEGSPRYVRFAFKADDDSVHYRRDLALKWFAPAAEEEPEEPQEPEETALEGFANPGVKTYFSMTFAFEEIKFTRFSFVFQSAEENISKEGTATNSVVFFYENDALSVAVRNASEQPDEDEEEEDDWTPETKYPVDFSGDLTLSINEEGCEDGGEFSVLLNDVFVGRFTNVGGFFMEYLSSASSTPRDPISFVADKLSEDEDHTQYLVMKDLNGQNFEINDNGRVTDSAPAVLVINEAVYAYTLGRRWSLTYEAIDVCDTSVGITRRYAMVNAPEEGSEVYPKPLDTDYDSLTTSTVFMPTSDKQSEEQYVSIYFELDDGQTLTNAEKAASRIYLTWYAVEDAVKTLSSAAVYECPVCGYQVNKSYYEAQEGDWVCPNPDNKEGHTNQTKKDEFFLQETVNPFDYIIVNRQKGGPVYIGLDERVNEKGETENYATDDAIARAEAYQQLIDDVAYKTETDESGTETRTLNLSAGDGSYFYLPSLRGLIESDYADYRNLRFSIYYKKQSLEVGSSASSATSLRYNALRFEIDEEGKYVFKVMASDAASNNMQCYVDGKLQDVTSTNIWDIDAIPEFSFEVGYNGATIEDPGEQSIGYRDTSYTVSSFDIVGLSGYETEYKLYYFDTSKLPAGVDEPSYSDLAKNTKHYLVEDASYKDSFMEIKKYNSDVTEDDADRWNRTDNSYHWDPDSSLSFVPQERGYYVVELTVTEARLPGYSKTAYQAIRVENPIDRAPDATYWLENNVTSVVLFSISAVLLIIIVVLFVVKPSNKSVEEVDLNTLKGGKNRKEKKDRE